MVSVQLPTAHRAHCVSTGITARDDELASRGCALAASCRASDQGGASAHGCAAAGRTATACDEQPSLLTTCVHWRRRRWSVRFLLGAAVQLTQV
jgi:hypothetical protein